MVEQRGHIKVVQCCSLLLFLASPLAMYGIDLAFFGIKLKLAKSDIIQHEQVDDSDQIEMGTTIIKDRV